VSIEYDPMTSETSKPWFVFKIEDADETGIEPSKLARLLVELSSALYAIARVQIDEAPNRPGRRTLHEDSLAGARIRSVVPGSTTIELVPPAAGVQPRLISEEPDADTVMSMFAEEIANIEREVPTTQERWMVRTRVRAVLERAGDIGSRGSLVHNPLAHRRGHTIQPIVTTFRVRDLPDEKPLTASWNIKRKLSGRAYMTDVEPGREKMRLKLPDGRDLTLEAGRDVVRAIDGHLDRIVEVDIVESMQGDASARRVVESVRILPSSQEPTDIPPKTLDEIEAELKLPPKPNYLALATGVWRTANEVDAFEKHVSEIRQTASIASRDDD
jgi:hypothetical protein